MYFLEKIKDYFFCSPLPHKARSVKILWKHVCFLNYNYIFKQTICWWCNCKRHLKLSCLYLIHRIACFKEWIDSSRLCLKFTCKLWLCKPGFILDHIFFFIVLWKWTILTIATNVLWESVAKEPKVSFQSSLELKGRKIIHLTCECQ